MASPKDKQAELRTKVSVDLWRQVDRYADRTGKTLYQATRDLIITGLNAERSSAGHPKSADNAPVILGTGNISSKVLPAATD